MPVAPPPGAMHMPSAALLGGLKRAGPTPPVAAPPPGFYGRVATMEGAPPPQAMPIAPAPSMPWPQMQPPAVVQHAPTVTRAPPPGFLPTQPAPPTAQAQQPPRAMTVAELEARLSSAPLSSPQHGTVRVLPRPPPAVDVPQATLPSSAPLGHERALQPWAGGGGLQAVEADALQPGASYASMSGSAPQLTSLAPAAAAQRQRPQESKYMSAEQVEQILRIQWAATHPADVAPYDADYYALAFAAKRGGSGFGNGSSAAFVPHALRELANATGGKATTAFVQLEGLGKVPFGNVRRPKPLIELALASELKSATVGDDNAAADADLSDIANATPLETHPRVALRLMLEDGLCLLADVDDCDRLLMKASSGASSGIDVATLMRRKTLLLEGLTATLRLPCGPEPPKTTAAEGGAGCGDAVLRAVGSLSKGRRMLAGLLTRLTPGGASAARVAWSLARSLRFVFSSPRQPLPLLGGEIALHGGDNDDHSFAALADAASSVIGTFTPLQLCAVLAAVLAGGSLPVLDSSQPGAAAAKFLAAVLRSSTARGLAGPAEEGSSSAMSAPEASVWQATFAPFFASLSARVAAAMAAAATAAASGDSTLVAVARRDVPVELLRAAVPHASPAQRAHLRHFLALLGAS